MTRTVAIFSALLFCAQEPPAQDVNETTARAVVAEIDRLKTYLVAAGERKPEILATLRQERPDLSGVFDSVEREIKEVVPKVKRNIKALSAEELEVRTVAAENLAALGPVALPYLRELLTSTHADLRAQAQGLIDRLSPPRAAKGAREPSVMELYDVGDLAEDLAKAKIDLEDSVRRIAAPECDQERDVAAMGSRLLLVRAPPATQLRVMRLLTLLRAALRK
jgi:hypothetical protein